MHARAPCSFLHLIEPSLLLIKLLLDLLDALQLPCLRSVVGLLVLYVTVRSANRYPNLIDARLQGCHLFLLRQDLRLPLLRGSLLRHPLLHGTMRRTIIGRSPRREALFLSSRV